jgi:arylsulfatase A-like enzyme
MRCRTHHAIRFASALVTWAVACAPPPPAPPHVVLVTIDTLRADHVSGYGYPRQTTPAIDRLMAEGVTWLAASTPMPTTAPSHTSLLTGTYPRTHGVVKNGFTLGAGRPTLADVLRAGGYRTAAVVSAFPLARRFGLARGFDHFDDTFLRDQASIDAPEWEGFRLDEAFDRRADATTDRALAWLASASGSQPVFLWVHYYDPHSPYDPPPAYQGRFPNPEGRPGRLGRMIAAYDAETRFVDDNVARLIDRIDTTWGPRNVVVVVATDHGEGLMDHGWMEHGIDLYEELVRVALVFRWSGTVVAGARPAVPVSLIDVAPTLLALLGHSTETFASDGVDLSRILRGGDAAIASRPLFFERRLYTTRDQEEWPAAGPMLAVRAGSWKYIEAPEQGVVELFDLATDPRERDNRHDAEADTRLRLAGMLRSWQSANAAAPNAGVSPEDAARLRALGYVE